MKLTVAGYCIIIQGCQYFSPPPVAEPKAQLWCRVWACICKLVNFVQILIWLPQKNEGKKFGKKSSWKGREFKKQSLATCWISLSDCAAHMNDESLTVTMKKKKKNFLDLLKIKLCFEVCSIKRDRDKSLFSCLSIPLEKSVYILCKVLTPYPGSFH